MRTIEQFQKIWADLDWMHRNHNKPFWLVARENDYCLSVVEPSPADLAPGTAANLYDVHKTILKTVVSSKKF